MTSVMRTTLTIDDDIADYLKAQSRLHDKPFKQVVNDVLRRGMTPRLRPTQPRRFRVVPNASALAPGIDPRRLNRVNDQLEADEFAGQGMP